MDDGVAHPYRGLHPFLAPSQRVAWPEAFPD
jgi:hypothetical protein